jgi:hypothetical protein
MLLQAIPVSRSSWAVASRIIPPLSQNTTSDLANAFPVSAECVLQLVNRIDAISHNAQDNLIATKTSQGEFANRRRCPDIPYAVGDRVLLSTLHRRRDYQSLDSSRVTKFMPRFDGPYTILHANLAHSTYKLDLPNSPNICPTFDASELLPFHANDDSLYPSHRLQRPPPVMNDSIEEWVIDRIVAAHIRGRGWQYKVKWAGWGDENICWLPGSELHDSAALDLWHSEHPRCKLTITIPPLSH